MLEMINGLLDLSKIEAGKVEVRPEVFEVGSIDVSASVEGGELALLVVDTGIGIPLDALESIFDEFEQAPNSVGALGTGLGLPITRGIARLLGGSIGVSSTVGVGSTFTVRIPAVYKPNTVEMEATEMVSYPERTETNQGR